MKDENLDFLFKIVMVGDASVGKTNILSRYALDRFDEDSKSTIGVDFINKDLMINDRMVKAQIWDTAGQEKFRAIIKNYYSNAHGFVIVYDVTRKESFHNLKYWLEVVKASASPEAKLLIIGNKSDLINEREVNSSHGEKFASENNGFFMETSAKSNIDNCVEKAFSILIQNIYQRVEEREARNTQEGVSTFYRGSAKKISCSIQARGQEQRGKCCQF